MFILYIAVIYLTGLLVMNVAQLLTRRRITRGRPFPGLFLNNFVDSKVFYLYRFNAVPCITFVNGIDINRAAEYIRTNLAAEITAVYQHNSFNFEANELQFNISIFVMTDGRMIELGNTYAEVLHGNAQYEFARDLARQLADFRLETEAEVAGVFNHVQVAGFMRQQGMN
jgi:hypothetical protein